MKAAATADRRNNPQLYLVKVSDQVRDAIGQPGYYIRLVESHSGPCASKVVTCCEKRNLQHRVLGKTQLAKDLRGRLTCC